MSSLPPAIFFINGDINYPPVSPPTPPTYVGADFAVDELTKLRTQLFINDTMTKSEFDARVVADPNYPTVVHLQGLRILVILPTFQDYANRQYADVVMFLHQGLADIEFNRFGPPCHNFVVDRINMYQLLRAAGNPGVVILPWDALPHCSSCNYPFYCDRCHTFSGIKICGSCGCGSMCGCVLIDNQGIISSPIHLPNCDSEYHNKDFINRK